MTDPQGKPRRPPARPERPLIICKECGRALPHLGRGLCGACYLRVRRKELTALCPECGKLRPLLYRSNTGRVCKSCHDRAQKKLPITCPHCGKKARRHTAGLCQACWLKEYRKNGRSVRLEPDIKRALTQYERDLKCAGTRITFARLVNEILDVHLRERKYLPYKSRTGKYKKRGRMTMEVII